MARFVYAPEYGCDVGAHIFRTEKYGLLRDRLVQAGIVAADAFDHPRLATRDELELVHTPEYIDDLLAYEHSMRTLRSEMPISREIINSFILGAGGTILACRLALRERTMTMNLAGGFHHAFPNWAEGFCYINDVALGVRTVHRERLAHRTMVVDCDLHQGNGTAFIFADQPNVFTFSIHQQSIYPIKRQSDLDVGLPDFCPGAVYLDELRTHLLPAMDRHRPQFVLYVAGADPYEEDQIGSLRLSIEDLRRRDEIVLEACAERGIPAATVLAGGYAQNLEDTVEIHFGTAVTLAACDGTLV